MMALRRLGKTPSEPMKDFIDAYMRHPASMS